MLESTTLFFLLIPFTVTRLCALQVMQVIIAWLQTTRPICKNVYMYCMNIKRCIWKVYLHRNPQVFPHIRKMKCSAVARIQAQTCIYNSENNRSRFQLYRCSSVYVCVYTCVNGFNKPFINLTVFKCYPNVTFKDIHIAFQITPNVL